MSPKRSYSNLRHAIEIDPQYSVKSATDPDFLKFEGDVKVLLEERRRVADETASRMIQQAKQELAKLKDWRADSTFPSEWSSLQNQLSSAEANYKTSTFFGFLDANSEAKALIEASNALLARQRDFLRESLQLFSVEITAMIDRLRPRAQVCGSFSYGQAVGILNSMETAKITDYADFTKTKAILKDALRLLHQSIHECRARIAARNNGRQIVDLILGGIILALLLSWILMFSGEISPGTGGKLTLLFIGGTVIMAIFRSGYIKNLSNFSGEVGSEPSLQSFDQLEAKCVPPQQNPDTNPNPDLVRAGKPEIGKIYRGKVVTTKEFGAFVEFLPGKDGLVHISKLANFRVKQTEDIVKVGDEICVKLLGVDEKGWARLSRKAAMMDRDSDLK